jgi:hypothetical protein
MGPVAYLVEFVALYLYVAPVVAAGLAVALLIRLRRPRRP